MVRVVQRSRQRLASTRSEAGNPNVVRVDGRSPRWLPSEQHKSEVLRFHKVPALPPPRAPCPTRPSTVASSLLKHDHYHERHWIDGCLCRRSKLRRGEGTGCGQPGPAGHASGNDAQGPQKARA